jgi:hypothetical protein
MRLCLVDDSVAFDGRTPAADPLGGAERAVAGLAAALAARGSDVTVFNRCPAETTIDGLRWAPLAAAATARTDVLIASRVPRLLQGVPVAGRRVLWVTGHPGYLEKPAVAGLLDRLGVTLLFVGRTQAATYRGGRPGLTVAPAAAAPFLASRRAADGPPVAVVTTHPAHGLGWLLDLWADEIHPRVPDARLHVYSALLDRARSGALVADEIRHLHDRSALIEDLGVRILAPGGEAAMAEAYATARCHLYPGHREDMACWTLVDSQASGLPAVARSRGAAHERIANGQTGYVVPDDAAFANVAVQMLSDDGMARGLSEAARADDRRRPWSLAAAEVETLWSPVGEDED